MMTPLGMVGTETGPCELCNAPAVLSYYGKATHLFCDECRAYFAAGFNIDTTGGAI